MLKNMSVKSKILSLSLGGLIFLGLAIGIESVVASKEALMNKSYASLTSAREIKKSQIESFFAERIGDIKVLAKSKDVKELIYDFHKLEKELNFNPNKAIPIDNVSFKKVINKHDSFFQDYMNEYGYYDIFLLDGKTGHVLYTAAKESDFGANLRTGSLKNSGLGEVYQKVLETKKATFVDMKPYEPSNGAPAMFLGNPIYIGNKLDGILVLQISDKSINKIMQFRKGYGDSQEDYLVGSDKLMRSDSFLDPKGHSLKASFANPGVGSVDTQAARNALMGKVNTEVVIDYNGNPVLSAYSPLKIGEDLTWAILSEIDEAEVLKDPNELRNIIIIFSVVIILIIAVLIYFVITKTVIEKLYEFQDGLLAFFKYLNRESDEVKLLEDSTSDEFGEMSKVVNENIKKTQKNIDEDRKLIDETIFVLGEFEQGDLCQRLDGNVSNPALMELKSVLNKMADNMETNIDDVLNILEQYSNYQYLNKIPTKDLKEHLLKLANGVNTLGDSITDMLVDNKSNGLSLDDSSNILLENVDLLNKNSNEAAAALEETAAALEEITSNISNNTDNVVKMSGFAENLTKSANEGQKLAQETTISMDEINTQVTAINEAITVIDQIAFQTNILSLNAAVEAATAGEAGKGFAVVAGEVRNLAARSAEAASEIKTLVENATSKANSGKNIADKMIHGYDGLNDNISRTLDLIKDVEMASKEQLSGINQINDAITSLDQQTQQNAMIATQTHDVAVETDGIAKLVVSHANEKEFRGKDTVKAKSFNKKNSSAKEDIETIQKVQKARKEQSSKKIVSNVSEGGWESF